MKCCLLKWHFSGLAVSAPNVCLGSCGSSSIRVCRSKIIPKFGMEQTGCKRTVKLLDPAEIAQAMSFTCTCHCALKWTREGLQNARRHYLKRSLQEQMLFVYDILSSGYNTDLRTLTLSIAGMDSKGYVLTSRGSCM